MPNVQDRSAHRSADRRVDRADRASERVAAELPIVLDRASATSLTAQLAAGLREAIGSGALRPGEPVPATRAFCARLGVARGVVVSAYEQLIAEGYLLAGQGVGTRVHPALEQTHENIAAPEDRLVPSDGDSESEVPAEAGPMAPGLPDTSAVETPAWRAAWRTAIARAHLEAPALGDPQLRAGIAEHLRRMRATARPAEDVIVTAGAREGLDLLLTALGSTQGHRLVVGVEDPGYPSLRRVAARHDTEIVALPVDADGLDTSLLPDGLDLVLATPSHQYPLGGSLPLARRQQLLAWAARTGAVVVEDDYDSELRHTGSPLPALAALDDPLGGSVVLLGTFSKTVSPALSAGFLLAPARLRALIEPVRRDLGGPVPAVVQTALAEYLESGELRRHTARMRRRYAAQRERVVERLFGVPGVRVRPMSGGLHAVVQFEGFGRLAAAALEQRVVESAQEAGLGAVALSGYWQRRESSDGLFGLVIGTGGPYSTGDRDNDPYELALSKLRAILVTEVTADGESRAGVTSGQRNRSSSASLSTTA